MANPHIPFGLQPDPRPSPTAIHIVFQRADWGPRNLEFVSVRDDAGNEIKQEPDGWAADGEFEQLTITADDFAPRDPRRDMHEVIVSTPLPDALHDFVTHRASWMSALALAEANAAPSSDDHDDKGYWQHEIRAFNHAMAMFDQHFSAVVMKTAEDIDAFFAALPPPDAGAYGWVCYNGGPGSMFWMPTRELCEHELSDDIRPATALEKSMFERFGKATPNGFELEPGN